MPLMAGKLGSLCLRMLNGTEDYALIIWCHRIERKPRTTVKRQEVVRVLTRLASGKETESKYKDYLEEVALKLQEDLHEDIGFYMEYGELPIPFDDQF